MFEQSIATVTLAYLEQVPVEEREDLILDWEDPREAGWETHVNIQNFIASEMPELDETINESWAIGEKALRYIQSTVDAWVSEQKELLSI